MASEGRRGFWETTPLDDMSDEQWESLCDGCGRCCLQKLEDIDTGDVYFTRIACRLLDHDTCRCHSYAERFGHVHDCTMVRPLTAEKKQWLPETCAYRLLADQQPLPEWHPLVSGTQASVHSAGVSVRHLAVSENDVPVSRYEEFVISFDPREPE